MKKAIVAALFMLLSLTLTAYAYTGPGLGMGVIGVVLGILTAIGLALIAIIWYPLKRLFKRVFNKKEAPRTTAEEEQNRRSSL